MRRWDKPPVGPDRAFAELLGQEREHILGRLGDVLGQHLLACLQGAVRLVALEEVDIPFGVVADPSQEFEPVGQLDDVVVRPQTERLGLDLGFFLGRQDDHRDLARRFVLAKHPDQGQTVDVGHDQVLEDHRRLDLAGACERPRSVLAVMKRDVGFAQEHPADRLTDDRLVVDEQDRDLVLGQFRFGWSHSSPVVSRDTVGSVADPFG